MAKKTGAATTDRSDARQSSVPPGTSTSRQTNESAGKRKPAGGNGSDALTRTIERAAAKAGVSVEEFAKLPPREQNAFLIETKADAEHPENVAPTTWAETASLDRSPFNREEFAQDDLAKLIESVRTRGVIQPLLVRPIRYRWSPMGPVNGMAFEQQIGPNGAWVSIWTLPIGKQLRAKVPSHARYFLADDDCKAALPFLPKFEIIAGERRWRAATAVKLPKVPVIVRDVDDEEAIELQGIENLQRENLNAVHEAQKYQQLLDSYHTRRKLDPAAAMDRLVEKVGKAKSTIYERLRLLKLPDKARAAAIAGTLPASHAALIVKIDDAETAEAVAARILKPARHERASEHDAESGDTAAGLPVMSFRDTKHLVEQELRKLERRREFNKLRDEFVKKGNLVLSAEDNRKVFPNDWSHSPDAKSGFVRAEDWCPLGSNSRTWKEALGKFAPSPVLGKTKDGEAVILYAASEARAAAKKKGLKARTTDAGGYRHVETAAEKKAKEELAARQERFDATLALIGDGAKNVSGDSPQLWRFLFEQIVRSGTARGEGLRKRLGIKGDYWDHKPLLEHFKGATAKELRAAIAELLVGGGRPTQYGQPKWDSGFVTACEAFGVKLPTWNVGGAKQASGK